MIIQTRKSQYKVNTVMETADYNNKIFIVIDEMFKDGCGVRPGVSLGNEKMMP